MPSLPGQPVTLKTQPHYLVPITASSDHPQPFPGRSGPLRSVLVPSTPCPSVLAPRGVSMPTGELRLTVSLRVSYPGHVGPDSSSSQGDRPVYRRLFS